MAPTTNTSTIPPNSPQPNGCFPTWTEHIAAAEHELARPSCADRAWWHQRIEFYLTMIRLDSAAGIDSSRM
jgi:hypothetical protein